jgi:site-specific DNA recombinase
VTKSNSRVQPAGPKTRAAIYTRKSTEAGLEQEFNSLDAQREAAEAFTKSQGWDCLPTHYDDGGFSGANTDRPALQRLLADVEAGRIDCVVVYKIDRLSRSLLDFAKLIETFDHHQVSFVSVTQQFNTSTSMGRLVLNVLLSFAQFEREIISERTRDKIAATRRKGKWCGGHPLLGYDIDPQGFKLAVNGDEAQRVRAIFALYLEHEALLPVVRELQRRAWCGKRWVTRRGTERGGKRISKTALHKLLTNCAYAGKVRYKNEVHAGEHEALLDAGTWQRVQALLQRNGRSGGALVRNQFGALLKGLLRCTACGCAMTPAHTVKGAKRYRYYVCVHAQKLGWQTCPTKSVPAGEIEHFVVDRIRSIGRDRTLLAETLAAAHGQGQDRCRELESEQKGLERELARWHAEIRALVQQAATADSSLSSLPRLAELQERIAAAEHRAAEVGREITALGGAALDESEVAAALAAFTPVWGSLAPREQVRLIQLLIERVDFDGVQGRVAITFHRSGIRALADDLAAAQKEKNA